MRQEILPDEAAGVRAVGLVQRVLENVPSSWKSDLTLLQRQIRAADEALLVLRLRMVSEIFPEKGNCTVKARWEVIWLVDAYPEQTIAQVGLDDFLHSYRVNADLRQYRRIRDFVRLLMEPRSWGERLQGLVLRWCNILPS